MPNRSNMRSNRGSNDVVKAGDAARATEAGSNLYKDESNLYEDESYFHMDKYFMYANTVGGGTVIKREFLRPGDAARATEAGSNLYKGRSYWYVVTMPNGGTVISSQPLLHNRIGDVIARRTTKPVKALDLAAVALLAKFIVLNNENVTFVKFSSNKVINAYSPWVNIFQFLFGETFQTHVHNNPAQQLARFSAYIARPSLLLATDDVVRAALCGDEDLARRMITLNPNYLLQRGNAVDFSSRTYTGISPFQAALITGDDKMAEMMKPFFARLEGGEEKMQNQVEEIFPHGIKAHEAAQKRKSETEFVPMLNELIEAIKKAFPDDLKVANVYRGQNVACIDNALNKFRAEFTKLSQEKIFNPYYLLAAFEACANKFDWNNPDWNKLELFWSQVIGFVQRFLPATYAQAFAYGLADIVENKHSCPRSFNFTYDALCSFYPLVTNTGLGFNFAVSHIGMRSMSGVSIGSRFVNGRATVDLDETPVHPILLPAFSKLISNKNSRLSELIAPRAQSLYCCCIIQ